MTKQEYIEALTAASSENLEAIQDMTDEEFAVFNTVHGDAVPRILRIGDLNIDRDYQRRISTLDVQRRVRDYHAEGFVPLSVSERDDGNLYVYDGQHRMEVARALAETAGINPLNSYISSWVHYNFEDGQEGCGFLTINNSTKRTGQAYIWRVHHFTDYNEYSPAIREITNTLLRYGIGLGLVEATVPGRVLDAARYPELLRRNHDHVNHFDYLTETPRTNSIPYHINNLVTFNRYFLYSLYLLNGRPSEVNRVRAMNILHWTLSTILGGFPGDGNALKPEIIRGLFSFYEWNYNSTQWAIHGTDETEENPINSMATAIHRSYNNYSELRTEIENMNMQHFSAAGKNDTVSMGSAGCRVLGLMYNRYYDLSEDDARYKTFNSENQVCGYRREEIHERDYNYNKFTGISLKNGNANFYLLNNAIDSQLRERQVTESSQEEE